MLYPSGLRGRSAKPLFTGSNPVGTFRITPCNTGSYFFIQRENAIFIAVLLEIKGLTLQKAPVFMDSLIIMRLGSGVHMKISDNGKDWSDYTDKGKKYMKTVI